MTPKPLKIPPVVFGTSGLGNLFTALDDSVKLEIVKQSLQHASKPVVFDSAGKYGAGLALESLGKSLRELGVKPEEVIISNKLGWLRTELKTPEPTFEPGVWQNLKHDAVQQISYEGILECFDQGNELLGGYIPQLVSVHDPDEYLATAQSQAEKNRLYDDILAAYEALAHLKAQGKVQAVGVGAKNRKIIQKITQDVRLDWVMIANSLTIKNHQPDLLAFMQQLQKQQVQIINSAVFHAGFLIGGDYYDYRLIKPDTEENKALFKWRYEFFSLCQDFNIKHAVACVQFGLNAPGVVSIALNTTNPNRVKENVDMAHTKVPLEFWKAMQAKELIRPDYNFLPE